MRHIKWGVFVLSLLALQACRHPLIIVGNGDIVEVGNSGRGCTLEQFRAQNPACTQNEVTGDYFVNYKAVPRPGWRFVRWQGPCAPNSEFQHCRLDFSKATVDWWEKNHPNAEESPSTAVFQRIRGNTGYLIGPGAAVAGVSYATPTQRGVTGLDGSFQYADGEVVRFTIGDTFLGEVTGRARVTPFELAGMPVTTALQLTFQAADRPVASVGVPVPAVSFHWGEPGEFHEWPAPEYYRGYDREGPFHTLTNIAVLLLSLDEDADPQNGIVIRPGVAALFRDVRLRLDLNRYWSRSPAEPEFDRREGPGEFPTLRDQVNKASREARFRTPHGVVKPGTAIQHLYEALDMDPTTYAVCPAEFPGDYEEKECAYDAHGNLTWLRAGAMTFFYEYDAQGNLTRAEESGVGALRIAHWQYDALGNLTQHEEDRGGDGSPNKVESWQYDAFGNVTLHEKGSPTDEAMSGESWEHDASGRPTRYETFGGGARDTATWQYRVNGTLQKYEFNSVWRLGEEHSTWQYDTAGRLERYFREIVDADSTTQEIETWQYPAPGQATRAIFSHTGQAVPDRVAHYQFDADGNLVRFAWDEDGKPLQVETFQIGETGAVVRYEREFDPVDGTVDYSETWQYDSAGKPLRRAGLDASGALASLTTWKYDTHQNPTRYEFDADADGIFEEIHNWEYDASGNLTQHHQPKPEALLERWFYDEEGILTTYEQLQKFRPGGDFSLQYHATGWGHPYRFWSARCPICGF